jgi:hypothetical protein
MGLRRMLTGGSVIALTVFFSGGTMCFSRLIVKLGRFAVKSFYHLSLSVMTPMKAGIFYVPVA